MVQPMERTATFDAAYPPRVESIWLARSAVCGWAAPLLSDDDLLGDLAVVTSELMANAVAASEQLTSPIVLAARRAHDELIIEVTNEAAPGPEQKAWDMSDPLRHGGRGLLIVRSMVDVLAFRSTDTTTTVECHWRSAT